jgi:GT2 family glycosyltransferase
MESIPVVIIPVLNRFDMLEQAIQCMDYPIDNLLIIDNSNSYQMPSNLKVHENLKNTKCQVLNMPANMGVAGSWNLGIKCFPHAPYWLISSNDNHWMPGGLKKMSELSAPDKLVMSNQAWNGFSLGGDIVKKIGLFDENFYPAYSEDSDYMLRIQYAGLDKNIVWSTSAIYQVQASMTVHSDRKFYEKNVFTNKRNAEYRFIKSVAENPHVNCLQYDLQRRIDHEWLD